jgi:LPS sulfotransferase NodH
MHPMTAVSYLICTTPRSGSWLLCDALAQTGVAGIPQEYMLSHAAFDEEWGKPTKSNFSDFFARVREEATTANGVCGIKLHWPQVQYLLNVLEVSSAGLFARLAGELPGLVLIRLRRTDKLRQALSYHRALRQQQWWELADTPLAPEPFSPDLDAVGQLRGLLETQEREWDQFFAATAQAPLELCYEELVTDLSGQVCRVLEALGCDPQQARAAVVGISPRLRRQSDDRTELWVHQFISRRRSGLLSPAYVMAGETSDAQDHGDR